MQLQKPWITCFLSFAVQEHRVSHSLFPSGEREVKDVRCGNCHNRHRGAGEERRCEVRSFLTASQPSQRWTKTHVLPWVSRTLPALRQHWFPFNSDVFLCTWLYIHFQFNNIISLHFLLHLTLIFFALVERFCYRGWTRFFFPRFPRVLISFDHGLHWNSFSLLGV